MHGIVAVAVAVTALGWVVRCAWLDLNDQTRLYDAERDAERPAPRSNVRIVDDRQAS